MNYDRFEDLPVWQSATDLAKRTLALGGAQQFRRYGELRGQLERAALSIPTNIAEGFDCGTTSDLLAFLRIARGSAGETRSVLLLMERMGRFGDLKFEIVSLKLLTETVSRQLHGWTQYLQRTPVVGSRDLAAGSRRVE